jgi:hypothetical protein
LGELLRRGRILGVVVDNAAQQVGEHIIVPTSSVPARIPESGSSEFSDVQWRPTSATRRLFLSVVLCLGLTLTGALIGRSTAQAAPGMPPGVSTKCGVVTCSAYLSRGTTRSIANKLARYQNASNAAIASAAGAAFFPAGGFPALACAAAGAIYGGFAVDQFLRARDTNACIRLRYLRQVTPTTPKGVAIYVDRSNNCKN